jgi:flagellar hook assembly protein FlgD
VTGSIGLGIRPSRRTREFGPLLRLALALAAALLLALGQPAPNASAATSSAKVVVVVGPVAEHNAHYIDDAHQIAREARRYTSNVVEIITPSATWQRVKAAAQGASVFVYLGHGNGWPSPYPPFQTATQDGLGLDPVVGANGSAHVYYGEDYIRANIRLAPNAVVLLFHLCYAAGNSEPGLAEGTLATAKQRVDNYGAGFIGAGARAVFAEGHPAHPAVDYIRALFTTNRTMDQIFRAAPTFHHHVLGPYDSQRTPGLRYELDPEHSSSAFYRSLAGDFSMPASLVRAAPAASTGATPADFVVPGAAEVVQTSGAPFFTSAAKAGDPAGKPASTLTDSTRLRLTDEAAPMPDGTRVFAATVLGGSATGFVRARGLAPRDSAATVTVSLDRSGPWLSPNSDGTADGLVVAARLSEPVAASLSVKNAAGTTVWTASQTNDIVRFAWDLRSASGSLVPDGTYTWTLRAKDTWGNSGVNKSGSFTIDHTAPVTKAAISSTAGRNGWSVSPATVTLTATDARSGVASTWWRLGTGTAKRYGGSALVTADGTRSFGYRSVDRAGIREAWRTVVVKIDRTPPVIKTALAGTASLVAGTWRSAVSLTPRITDTTAGVAAKTVSVDGKAAVSLGTSPVVVAKEGAHALVLVATDLAGNRATTTVTFTIDTTAPIVKLPGTSPAPPTVTPNGDGVTDTVTLPYTVSEAGTVKALITAPDGSTVVRTINATVAAGHQTLVWDGRNDAGKAVHDGRYTVTLAARDLPGNKGAAVSEPVDVYAALSSLARDTSLFYAQDADKLASRATFTFTLRSAATVTIAVVDAAGKVVRAPVTAKAFPAGPITWRWTAKADDGSYVPQGRYRVVVTATNGTQTATQTMPVDAAAFRLASSTAGPARGHSFTLTATSAEPLGAAPVVTVRQPGVAPWTVTMTRVSSNRWTATIRPKAGGTAGDMTLTVRGKDSNGGRNQTDLHLALT